MVVQDPFELCNNLTAELNDDAMHVWKRIVRAAKDEFHQHKLYRIFHLKDLPSKLKERLEAGKNGPEISNPAASDSSETVPDSVQAGSSLSVDLEEPM